MGLSEEDKKDIKEIVSGVFDVKFDEKLDSAFDRKLEPFARMVQSGFTEVQGGLAEVRKDLIRIEERVIKIEDGFINFRERDDLIERRIDELDEHLVVVEKRAMVR
ncbi:hypothetical protein A3A21_03025 [Candidatus Jorgensenbacteria bacterium RIFCSPLOWO2_01_FULL_45_25b]|uniref:Uncharacterized protein n=1 Tax=Candidatus Jorgensenbacteria bacterium RIFCSPLOWO2_01_FULL_45_25b TaxID=1798471 RepID=A0A1F6BUQ1_9BACT|nr:MAG: hypothetical protein A3A21_03025 [Candidatus Jorgensenbacteria bacterium RIFCSPLOWO2_01_FULL_45_25b]